MIAGLLSSLIIDIGWPVRASSPVQPARKRPIDRPEEPSQREREREREREKEGEISMAIERRAGRKGAAALILDGPVFENSW